MTVRHIGSYDNDQNGTEVEAQTTVDARYSIALDGLLGGESTVLGLGVVNLFDTAPPRLAQRPFYDEEVHDLRGRQLYVNIKQTF